MNSFIITDTGLSMVVGFKPYNVDATHPKYQEIVAAVREGRFEEAAELYDIANVIEAEGRGRIEVDRDNACVRYNGNEVHNSLVDRILRMLAEGFDINPLLRFLDNLMQNPSNRAVNELYTFLEYGKMPITEDGCFLAYKRVREDYMSVHDGKTDNSVGNIVEMARNEVDDRSDNTCSHGLHFCSHEYLKSFSGSKVVVLKINPADVVSIPTDYNNTKGRACRYEVVGELSPEEVEKALSNGVWSQSVVNDYDDEDADREFEDIDDDEWSGDEDDFTDEHFTDDEDFERGYLRGYLDKTQGSFYAANPVSTLEVDSPSAADRYNKGYYTGWFDAKEGLPSRFVQVDESIETVSEDYEQGYHKGYEDRRDGRDPSFTEPEDDYAAGYIRGYADRTYLSAKAKFNVKR